MCPCGDGIRQSRPPVPLLRFAAIPREITDKTRGQNGVALLFCRALRPLQCAGLSRRSLSSELPCPRNFPCVSGQELHQGRNERPQHFQILLRSGDEHIKPLLEVARPRFRFLHQLITYEGFAHREPRPNVGAQKRALAVTQIRRREPATGQNLHLWLLKSRLEPVVPCQVQVGF